MERRCVRARSQLITTSAGINTYKPTASILPIDLFLFPAFLRLSPPPSFQPRADDAHSEDSSTLDPRRGGGGAICNVCVCVEPGSVVVEL